VKKYLNPFAEQAKQKISKGRGTKKIVHDDEEAKNEEMECSDDGEETDSDSQTGT
jgi:hypothetical protein